MLWEWDTVKIEMSTWDGSLSSCCWCSGVISWEEMAWILAEFLLISSGLGVNIGLTMNRSFSYKANKREQGVILFNLILLCFSDFYFCWVWSGLLRAAVVEKSDNIDLQRLDVLQVGALRFGIEQEISCWRCHLRLQGSVGFFLTRSLLRQTSSNNYTKLTWRLPQCMSENWVYSFNVCSGVLFPWQCELCEVSAPSDSLFSCPSTLYLYHIARPKLHYTKRK